MKKKKSIVAYANIQDTCHFSKRVSAFSSVEEWEWFQWHFAELLCKYLQQVCSISYNNCKVIELWSLWLDSIFSPSIIVVEKFTPLFNNYLPFIDAKNASKNWRHDFLALNMAWRRSNGLLMANFWSNDDKCNDIPDISNNEF